MTNQERAAEVLREHWSVAQEAGQDDECDCCAQALADAGLLMPDLPEPPEWDWQYADYTPGVGRGFYTLDEAVEKGPELPDGTTRARRPVGEWEEDK